MYAVIFTAQFNDPDASYQRTAERLQRLAKSKYGCVAFEAVTEGGREIVISYWQSLADIAAWKQDPEHQAAQVQGKEKWYRSYRVQVVKIERDYGSPLR